jgi:DNA-binding transcriptional MerR regulator
VASRDPAFLWETEVLRSARRVRPEGGDTAGPGQREDDWLTLREASEVTGVPTSTIRKWARHDNIPSYLEQTSDGYLRLVSISGIRAWTDQIGREIGTGLVGPDREPDDLVVDLTIEERRGAPGGTEVPEGSMLVPLDAWNRMLNQLGNLHEAGQQLAEARERAAKAETEARFLKERLADLRAQLEASQAGATSAPDSTGSPAGQPGQTSLLRKAYTGWRDRRSRS